MVQSALATIAQALRGIAAAVRARATSPTSSVDFFVVPTAPRLCLAIMGLRDRTDDDDHEGALRIRPRQIPVAAEGGNQ